MKNVLVVGGSYFVGKVFVEEIAKRGECAVYAMNRGKRPLRIEAVREIVCDRHDPARIRASVPSLEWDAVVDFCAYTPEDVATLLPNLPGAVRRYVYISSAAVHPSSSVLPITEDSPKVTAAAPEPGGDYAYKKHLTELEVEERCEKMGIARLCLRPVFIYGKYNYAPRESYFFDLLRKEETVVVPTAPQALFSMVSVWDVANVCIACLGAENVWNGAYTVTPEELVSYDRLIEVLETISGRSIKVERQPVRVIERRGIPLPFPLGEHLVYSGSRLRGMLNYRYLSLLEGMTKTYHWYFKTERS